MAILPIRTTEENWLNDSPHSASMSSFELAEGDFIVLGTDGLWDNLSSEALLLKISKIKVKLFLILILVNIYRGRKFFVYIFV